MRRQKVRGTLSLKLLETAHIVASQKVSLPERAWVNYPGSNLSDTLQGVILPSLDDNLAVWRMQWKTKKALFGKKHLILVGGKTEGAENSSSGQVARRQDTTVEPVCFHPFPVEIYDSWVHGLFVKLVLDLSPLSAAFAWASLCRSVSYVCFCYTPQHALMLELRLEQLLKVFMAKPDCPLFNANYAKAIGAIKEEAVVPKAKAAKAKPKAKGKAKAKKKAKAADGDGSEGGGDEGSESEAGAEDDDELWDPLQE